MGCDFIIKIQVLHGNSWVTIISFGAKTSCGGFPLTKAPKTLYKKTLIHGDYHRDDPIMMEENNDDEIIVKIVESSEPKLLMKRKRKENDCNEEKNDDEDVDHDQLSLYYSCEQFEKLLSYIEPLPDHYNKYLYNHIMSPVPKWMKMAMSSLPINDSIWMSDREEDIATTTEDIEVGQIALLRRYEAMLLKVFEPWGHIPLALLPIIASYALPRGQDVRLSWYDDERQCEEVRNATDPSEIRATPPPCVMC